jgi:hypothetical protein
MNLYDPKEHEKLTSLISKDIEHSLSLYDEIAKKCQELLSAELATKPDNQAYKEFIKILNSNFEVTEEFHTIYRSMLLKHIELIQTV